MVKPKKPKEKLHMGTVSHDVNVLSDSPTEEICKSLRKKNVKVVMKSRMRESRTYGSVRTSHREV